MAMGDESHRATDPSFFEPLHSDMSSAAGPWASKVGWEFLSPGNGALLSSVCSVLVCDTKGPFGGISCRLLCDVRCFVQPPKVLEVSVSTQEFCNCALYAQWFLLCRYPPDEMFERQSKTSRHPVESCSRAFPVAFVQVPPHIEGNSTPVLFMFECDKIHVLLRLLWPSQSGGDVNLSVSPCLVGLAGPGVSYTVSWNQDALGFDRLQETHSKSIRSLHH